MKLLLLLLQFTPAQAEIPANYAATVTKALGKKAIPAAECGEMESKMGQLLYITADGFGSDHVIHPAYNKLVKRIQPGGVLPHYGSGDIDEIKEASAKLQAASTAPLMIGVDYVSLSGKKLGKSNFGLGFGSGIAGTVQEANTECYGVVGRIEAALHRYAGINNPLGPTIEHAVHWKGILDKDLSYKEPRLRAVVDAMRGAGLETTIKHFPYTPETFNLHDKSEDTKVPEKVVDEKYMPIFSELGQRSGFLMTTHLFNSEVDPANMATFSKRWMQKLREEVGFRGIVMTDALFMISSYEGSMKQMAASWPSGQMDAKGDAGLQTIFAIKSILAGHDMVFVATAARETETLWKELVKFSCGDNALAEEFRGRVRDSHERILGYKNANPQLKETKVTLSREQLKVLTQAKKDIQGACAGKYKGLESILAKVTAPAPRIDSFPCAQGAAVGSGLAEQIASLASDVREKILPELLLQALDSENPDDLAYAIKYFREHPELSARVKEEALRLLKTGDGAKLRGGLNAMAILDLWDGDSSFIDQAIESGNGELIDLYFDARTKGNAPSPSPAVKEKSLAYLRAYLKKNPVDLVRDQEISLRLAELLFAAFPPEALLGMRGSDISALDLPIDIQVMLLNAKVGGEFRGNGGSPLAGISPGIVRRQLEISVANPLASTLRFQAPTCELVRLEGSKQRCEKYGSNLVTIRVNSGYRLDSSVSAVYSVLRESGNERLREFLPEQEKAAFLGFLDQWKASADLAPDLLASIEWLQLEATDDADFANEYVKRAIGEFQKNPSASAFGNLMWAVGYMKPLPLSAENLDALVALAKEQLPQLREEFGFFPVGVADFLRANPERFTAEEMKLYGGPPEAPKSFSP